jgi:hypothetical protein
MTDASRRWKRPIVVSARTSQMQENLGDQDMIVSNQMAFMDVYNTMMKNTIERTGLGDGLQ